MSTKALDPRRYPYRDDLAAEELREKVSAPRYAAGQPRQVVHSATALRASPEARASWTTDGSRASQAFSYDEIKPPKATIV